MPGDAGRAGTPAGVFGAELRFCRTRAGLSQQDLAAGATVWHDVIDLLNRNVLVAGDGSRLVAVFDWGCSAYGDFLYEVAWFTFWAPWHAGLAAIDFRSVMRGHYDATGLDVPFFDERLRCYELHIGLTHLAYRAFAGGREEDLHAVARRTREILEAGNAS